MAAMQGTRRVWKETSEFKGKADAELVQNEIDFVASQDPNGKCQNKALVNYARQNPKSESYKCFEWNNRQAADKYRLHQAARIKDGIRTIYIGNATEKVQRSESKPLEIEVVTNHCLPTPGEGHKSIEIILTSQTDTLAMQKEMYDYIRSCVKSFKTRFALTPGYSQYVQDLEAIVAKLP